MKRLASLSFAVPLLAAAVLAQTEPQSSNAGSTASGAGQQGSMSTSTTTTNKTHSEHGKKKWMSGERQTWRGVLVDSGCMASQQMPGMSSSSQTQGYQHQSSSEQNMSGSEKMNSPERSSQTSSDVRSSETRSDASGSVTRSESSSSSERTSSTTTDSGSTSGVQRTSDAGANTGKATMAYDPTTGRMDPSCTINKNSTAYALLLDDGRVMRLDTSESATAQNNISMFARQSRDKGEKVEISGAVDSGTIHVRSARRQ